MLCAAASPRACPPSPRLSAAARSSAAGSSLAYNQRQEKAPVARGFVLPGLVTGCACLIRLLWRGRGAAAAGLAGLNHADANRPAAMAADRPQRVVEVGP